MRESQPRVRMRASSFHNSIQSPPAWWASALTYSCRRAYPNRSGARQASASQSRAAWAVSGSSGSTATSTSMRAGSSASSRSDATDSASGPGLPRDGRRTKVSGDTARTRLHDGPLVGSGDPPPHALGASGAPAEAGACADLYLGVAAVPGGGVPVLFSGFDSVRHHRHVDGGGRRVGAGDGDGHVFDGAGRIAGDAQRGPPLLIGWALLPTSGGTVR